MTAGPALSPVPWFQFIFKSESPSVCLQVTVFKCNFASDTINISRAHVCPRRWAEACVCISLTNMKIGAGTQGVRLRNGSPPFWHFFLITRIIRHGSFTVYFFSRSIISFLKFRPRFRRLIVLNTPTGRLLELIDVAMDKGDKRGIGNRVTKRKATHAKSLNLGFLGHMRR